MASEKQIAANRRNARKSTGPKTKRGKTRSSANSQRHGLSAQAIKRHEAERLGSIVKCLVGGAASEELVRAARDVAHAHLDLACVREIKVALIHRVFNYDGLVPAPILRRSLAEEIRCVTQQHEWPQLRATLPAMPTEELSRADEAVRGLLPELRKLDRYEARAFSAKLRALRRLSLMMSRQKDLATRFCKTNPIPTGNQ